MLKMRGRRLACNVCGAGVYGGKCVEVKYVEVKCVEVSV
jgi:hypothetical protein